MDRIRKSVVKRHLALLILIRRGGVRVSVFLWISDMLSINYNYMENHVVRHNRKLRTRPQGQANFMIKNTYYEYINQDHLRHKGMVAEKKKRHVSVNGLY